MNKWFRFNKKEKPLVEPVYYQEEALKRRSVFIRHLDCGSCNGCELELSALSNQVYDMEQYGLRLVSSPRHADVLVMTGVFTRNLERAAELTLEAMPEPAVIRVGDCAVNDGDIFKASYAVTPLPEKIRDAVVGNVPGCPPEPEAILKVLFEFQKESES